MPAFLVRVVYDEISGYPHDIYIDYDDRSVNVDKVDILNIVC